MTLLCRYLGHRASQKMQRDPMTFLMHSECRRCHVPLVREPQGWTTPGEISAAAADTLKTA